MTKEFLRYFLVSLVALSVDLGIFSFALRVLAVPWAIAACLGFCAGLVTAYYLSIKYVFINRPLSFAPKTEFLTFAIIGVLGLLVTEIVLWLGIDCYQWNPEVSKLLAAVGTFLFNFLTRKFILFGARNFLRAKG